MGLRAEVGVALKEKSVDSEKARIKAELRTAIHHVEQAHRRISPETHGDDYIPIVNQVEDALEKLREVANA